MGQMEQIEQNRTMRPRNLTRPRRMDLSTIFFSIPSFAWLLLAALGLSWAGEAGNTLAWLIVTLWALRGPSEAVEAMLVGMIMVFLNSAVFNVSDQGLILRWVVLGVAAIRIIVAWGRHRFWRPSWLGMYAVFFAYLLGNAIFLSTHPSISVFKTLSLLVMSLAIYLGVALTDRDWGGTIATLGLSLAILSLPLLILPDGYLRNGHQFQGILSHPQTFGVVLSVPFAYLLAKWVIFRRSPINLIRLILLVMMFSMLVLSGARSGYLAALLAIILSVIWSFFWERSQILARILTHPVTYILLAALVASVGIIDLNEYSRIFFLERDLAAYAPYGLQVNESSSLLEQMFASRLNLMDVGWANFLEHPWFGIGLGIPSSLVLPSNVTRLGTFIISAPGEKGLFLTATLEEIGLVGAVLWAALTLAQLRVILASRQAAIICLSLAALLVTTGEFIYFSAGGLGVLVHVGIGIGLAAGERRKAAVADKGAHQGAGHLPTSRYKRNYAHQLQRSS